MQFVNLNMTETVKNGNLMFASSSQPKCTNILKHELMTQCQCSSWNLLSNRRIVFEGWSSISSENVLALLHPQLQSSFFAASLRFLLIVFLLFNSSRRVYPNKKWFLTNDFRKETFGIQQSGIDFMHRHTISFNSARVLQRNVTTITKRPVGPGIYKSQVLISLRGKLKEERKIDDVISLANGVHHLKQIVKEFHSDKFKKDLKTTESYNLKQCQNNRKDLKSYVPEMRNKYSLVEALYCLQYHLQYQLDYVLRRIQLWKRNDTRNYKKCKSELLAGFRYDVPSEETVPNNDVSLWMSPNYTMKANRNDELPKATEMEIEKYEIRRKIDTNEMNHKKLRYCQNQADREHYGSDVCGRRSSQRVARFDELEKTSGVPVFLAVALRFRIYGFYKETKFRSDFEVNNRSLRQLIDDRNRDQGLQIRPVDRHYHIFEFHYGSLLAYIILSLMLSLSQKVVNNDGLNGVFRQTNEDYTLFDTSFCDPHLILALANELQLGKLKNVRCLRNVNVNYPKTKVSTKVLQICPRSIVNLTARSIKFQINLGFAISNKATTITQSRFSDKMNLLSKKKNQNWPTKLDRESTFCQTNPKNLGSDGFEGIESSGRRSIGERAEGIGRILNLFDFFVFQQNKWFPL
ncbi:hypothetical protein WN51_13381 [Melipona quadrifasciata]|uniref:Uncharacterized protein n=1 Tax=Melipona quadrifasciata TaxID=166423 RepID=A0A0N0U5Q8_9HYME|nr:hypothetical protein WN51_13381 [Melipona quadrifasciata]